MEHPLAMDAEAMRRAGYATVDALVARLADPEADPVLRRADAGRARGSAARRPSSPADYGAVLARVMADVLPYAARTDHPGYLAFIPSFTTWPAALAELTAAAANLYCGAWMESAGAAQIELEVIDWFRSWLGLPARYPGRAALAGLDRADSVTLDPHKWLYQPMECGCVLIRDGARLERTFAIHPDYLDGNAVQGAGEVNFADRGLQLSRGFRALKVWVTVHTFGLTAFRACIQRNLELAEYAEALIRSHPELTLMAPATLGIVCFRREWPGCGEAETERRGTALAEELERGGTALVSTTRLAGQHAVRLCILNPTSSAGHIRQVIEHFAGAPAPAPARRRCRTAARPAPMPGPTSWRTPAGTYCAPSRYCPACPPPPGTPSMLAASRSMSPRGRRSSAAGIPTGSSTSSWPAATTSSSTPGSSAPTAPVTTSASSPPATGAVATATLASPPSAVPNRAGS